MNAALQPDPDFANGNRLHHHNQSDVLTGLDNSEVLICDVLEMIVRKNERETMHFRRKGGKTFQKILEIQKKILRKKKKKSNVCVHSSKPKEIWKTGHVIKISTYE